MKPEKLSQETFAPYGTVISEKKEHCDVENEQFAFYANIALFDIPGEGTVGILEGKQREMVLKCMERHVKTPEILFQIYRDAILFVGRSDGYGTDIKDIKAFLLQQGQTVIMAPGIWHWVPYPVDADRCITQVIFKKGTSDTDYEIAELPEVIRISERKE